MVLLIALAVLALWMLVATLREVRRDGHRAVPTDWSRVAGRDVEPAPARSSR